MLPRPETDGNWFKPGKEYVQVPQDLCRSLVLNAPTEAFKGVPPERLGVNGFRTLEKVSRPLLYNILAKKPLALSCLLTIVCSDALKEIQALPEEKVEENLPGLLERFGTDQVRYALLMDARANVRQLSERDELFCDTTKAEEEDVTQVDSACPPAHETEDTAPGHDGKPDAAISKLQRRLAALEAELKRKDKEIERLSQEIGKRDRIIGELNRELEAARAEAEQSAGLKQRLLEAQKQLQQHKDLTAKELELDKRAKELAAIYGDNLDKMKSKLVWAYSAIHDLQAQWSALAFLNKKRQQEKERILLSLENTVAIPLSACVEAVIDFLREAARDEANAAFDPSRPLADRFAHADQVKRHLELEEKLTALKADGRSIPLPESLKAVFTQHIRDLRALDFAEETLEGAVRFEGPGSWLVTDDGEVLGLITDFTAREGLHTGDRVSLTLSSDPDGLVDMEAELIHEVGKVDLNACLKLDDCGIFVETADHWRYAISEAEFWRSGLSIGDPVQVRVPDWHMLPEHFINEPVHAQIVRVLTTEPFRAPRTPKAPQRRRRAPNLRLNTALPQILAGRKLLVIGGDGLEEYYRSIVTGMGGMFDWQSGFSNLNRTAAKAGWADVVVIITGRVYHKIAWQAEAEARRTGAQILYCNTVGKTSFAEFLFNAFSPDGAGPQAVTAETGSPA